MYMDRSISDDSARQAPIEEQGCASDVWYAVKGIRICLSDNAIN